MTTKKQVLHSVYKVAEGGFGQSWAMTLLKGEGIPCAQATSPFVGQTGVVVFGNKRIQKRAERILFNY